MRECFNKLIFARFFYLDLFRRDGMNILHIAPINMYEANGFRFSVPGLTSAQNKVKGITAALLNIEAYDKVDEHEICEFEFKFFPKYIDFEELENPFNKPDIVIFHGVYHPIYLKVYKRLKKLDIPYVIVPRVSLTEGAQKQKYLKKKLGNAFWFKRFINNAAMIHYLTVNEKELSKRFKKESFIVGNGIKLPNKEGKGLSENRNITFIGRYDLNHKGLDILVDSIVTIKKELSTKGIKIRFFGSDFRGGKLILKN